MLKTLNNVADLLVKKDSQDYFVAIRGAWVLRRLYAQSYNVPIMNSESAEPLIVGAWENSYHLDQNPGMIKCQLKVYNLPMDWLSDAKT